jgi:hypothetical protein
MYCLGERKQVTAYGYSANDTSSIANITSLNCSDTFIAKPYTISTISIVSMMGMMKNASASEARVQGEGHTERANGASSII